jgi:hypothetical protein
MLTVVAIASLALAVISFLIFGYQVYLRRTQVTHQMKIAEDSLDLAKLGRSRSLPIAWRRWGRSRCRSLDARGAPKVVPTAPPIRPESLAMDLGDTCQSCGDTRLPVRRN